MKVLEKISVRKRLMAVLAIWISTFIFFGALAIREMNVLGNVTRELYYHSLPVANAAIEARVNIIKVQKDIRELILSRNSIELEVLTKKIEETDKIILDNLNIIKAQTQIENTKDLEIEVRDTFRQWQEYRKKIIATVRAGNVGEANELIKSVNNNFVGTLESLLDSIDNNSTINAENLTNKSKEIEQREAILLISTICTLIIVFIIIFIFVTKSILLPIDKLQSVMNTVINSGELITVDIKGNNEISRMSNYYNDLVNKLRYSFFIKDNQNQLNEKVSVCDTIEEFAETTISHLARATSAAKGIFYVYNRSKKQLELKGTFAFSEEDKPLVKIIKGEGIIGQVALEKKAIMLKSSDNINAFISTGISREKVNNIYAFPLMYKEELYGVIELASLNSYEEKTIEFLESISNVISINLYSAMQRERIKELFKVSEEARREANEKSRELAKANETLNRHQEYLQQQSAELQQSNAELEEQQQLLQQQSEELQQTNAELEEQQQLLQQQSEEMQQTNTILEEQQEQLNEQKDLFQEQNRRLEAYTVELSKKTQELELTNKYKSEFLSNMSHELRTPLNSIILLSKLLLDKSKERLSIGDEEKIAVINKSGQELLRLINDVLDLSKVESGVMSLDKYNFHSRSISKEIKDMFVNVAIEKGLEFQVKDKLSKELYGDEHKISQILRNLISNAIKFTEKGQVELEIQEDTLDKGTVIFAIKDTGIGISKEKQAIIFNEFQQGDGSVSRKYGGTGLGLSISKKLAEIMDGEIKVNSIPGQGSEFLLRIPNLVVNCYKCNNTTGKKSHNEDVDGIGFLPVKDIESEKSKFYINGCSIESENYYKDSKKLSQSVKESKLSLKGKTILIVDDDPRNIFTLASTLEEYDGTVIEASNGRSALDKLHKKKIDLVLTDIMMPEMDGYEVITHIRKDENYNNIPIIAVTAKSLKEEREKCIAVGASDYVSKPVDYDSLIRIIKAWIDR